MPHQIRLRGPWNVRDGAELASDHTPQRMTMPCRVSDVRRAFPRVGSLIFERRFQSPTGLSPRSQVDLVLSGLSGAADALRLEPASITLNETLLVQPKEHEPDSGRDANRFGCPVLPLLQPSNTLAVRFDVVDVEKLDAGTVADQTEANPEIFDVWLEITD
ncbi:MAG: hypothetical protein MPJ50_05630 [Pirellulales bacterium]|nr:hypothetical protein [Pirellulales bacterium]